MHAHAHARTEGAVIGAGLMEKRAFSFALSTSDRMCVLWSVFQFAGLRCIIWSSFCDFAVSGMIGSDSVGK